MSAPLPTHSAVTARLLSDPLLPTLVRLSAPVIATTAIQAFVAVAEVYFISQLGNAELAGAALCLPVVMVMTAVTVGGIGGGIASALARALGAGRRDEAARIAAHALWLCAALGAAFTIALELGGATLYRTLGGSGAILAAATAYSNVFFAGAIPFWLMNALASVWRGGGQPGVPALISSIGALITLIVSPLLIFGVGDWPGWGVSGAAAGLVLFYVLALIAQVCLLFTRWAPVKFSLSSFRLETKWFAAILRVGFPAALNALQGNLTAVLLAALIAPFGENALAGFGAAARIEYVLIPVVFGLGAGMIPLVGACVGAGMIDRARQAAWTGAVVAASFGGIVGVVGACLPSVWMGLFTTHEAVADFGSSYLLWVGPAYVAFSGGLALVFAAQGAGQALTPMLVGTARLVIATGGGYLATRFFAGGPAAVFAALAAAQWAFGLLMVIIVLCARWRQRR